MAKIRLNVDPRKLPERCVNVLFRGTEGGRLHLLRDLCEGEGPEIPVVGAIHELMRIETILRANGRPSPALEIDAAIVAGDPVGTALALARLRDEIDRLQFFAGVTPPSPEREDLTTCAGVLLSIEAGIMGLNPGTRPS